MRDRRHGLGAGGTALAVFIASWLAGCPEPDPDRPDPPETPILGPFDPARVVATPDQPIDARIEARFADGSLAGGGEWSWLLLSLSGREPEPAFTEASPEPGVRVVSIAPSGWLGILQVVVRYRLCADPDDGATCADAVPAVLEVEYVSGEADEILPPTESIALAVGERRPYQPFTVARGPGAASLIGAQIERVEYETDDPAVASVDARGLLEGISAGETTLRFRSGSARAEVPVIVTEATLGPPPDGRVAVLVGSQTAEDRARQDAGLEGRLDVDARGWPAYLLFAGPAVPSYRPPLFVAQWTGTGFGYEQVSESHEQTARPRLAVDAEGNVVVTWTDEAVARVAMRRVDAPLEWTVSTLDIGEGAEISSLRGFGYDPPSPGILGRPEGGAWITYTPLVSEPAEGACPYYLRLFDVEPGAPIAHEDFCLADPALFWQAAGDPNVEPPISIQLAPYAGDPRGRPQVFLTTLEPDFLDGAVFGYLLRPGLTGFEMRHLLPRIYEPTGELDLRLMPETAFVTPGASGDRPWATWMRIRPATPTGPSEVSVSHATLDELWDGAPLLPPFHLESTFGGGADPIVFGLGARDQRYLGVVSTAPMIRVEPTGMRFLEDPNSALHPDRVEWSDPDYADAAALAMRGHGERLHFVWQQNIDRVLSHVYGAITVPERSTTATSEDDGQRIHVNASTPSPQIPMLELADGSRILSTRGGGGRPEHGATTTTEFGPIPEACGIGRMRSPGAGAPFVEWGDPMCSVDYFTWWTEHEGVVWALDGLEIHRSDDGGRTFRRWLEVPGWNAIGEILVDHQGTLWVSGRVTGADGRVGFVARVATSTAFEELDFTGTPLEGVMPSHLRVVGDELHVSNLGLSSRLAVFDLSGNYRRGAMLARSTTGDLLTWTLHPTETGWMFFGHRGSSGDPQHFVVHVDRDYTREDVVPVGDPSWLPASLPEQMQPPVTLPDGRIAVAHVRRSGVEREEAFLVTSADGGRTWTEPRALLPPTAGYGQRIASLSVGTDGALLVLVGDNEALRSFENWEYIYPPDMWPALFPHFAYRLVRIADP